MDKINVGGVEVSELPKITLWSRIKGTALAAMWTTALGGPAILIAASGGVNPYRVCAFIVAAVALDAPVTWLWRSFAKAQRNDHEKIIASGDGQKAKEHSDAYWLLATAYMVLNLLIWAPVRWIPVYLAAFGWL